MGQTASVEYNDLCPATGYRVLHVCPKSPAADVVVFPDASMAKSGQRTPKKGELVPYFDVIISIDGILLDFEACKRGVFGKELRENIGKPVILEVYNIKQDSFRTVQVTPRDDWGGDGLLGVQIRWSEYQADTVASVLHIVEVDDDSPAAQVGLIAPSDFILGTADGPFASEDVFGDFVDCHLGEEVDIYVYNAKADTVRPVSLYISEHPWGPKSSTGLGLTLACGQIHLLPNRDTLGKNWLFESDAPRLPLDKTDHSAAKNDDTGALPIIPSFIQNEPSESAANYTAGVPWTTGDVASC